ncbi:MAG: glycosyltransferase [Cyclobacteriaceae bacterium]
MSCTVVLIPCLNAYEDLIESIKSIEYWPNRLDAVVVDDGSTSRINSSILEDRFPLMEFHVLRNEESRGIEDALNLGLIYIRENIKDCKYVARLDAGDLCKNKRLIKQEEYLNSHPNVHLVSSWVNYVDTNKEVHFIFKPNLKYEEMKSKIYLFNPFVHPSVIFRLDTIFKLGLYTKKYPALEDYALFMKLLKHYEAFIIPEILLDYEVNPTSISSRKRLQQTSSKIRLIRDNFYFGIFPIVGILKNILLLVINRNVSTYIKRLLR